MCFDFVRHIRYTWFIETALDKYEHAGSSTCTIKMAKSKQKLQSSSQKENIINGNQKVNKPKLNKIKPEKGASKIKKQKKKKVIEAVKEDVVIIPSTRKSDDAIPNKVS